MIVSSIEIERFRMLENQSFELGNSLTAIVGQNGTMKSTLLGMIGEPFRFRDPKTPEGELFRTIDGKLFELKFSDAFKFSDGPKGLERAGDHVWHATIDSSVFPERHYRAFTAPRFSKEDNSIRTWSGESKASGQKHAQLPVVYLSLKRLVPIGEESKVRHDPIELTNAERCFYEKYHCRILLLQQEMKHAEFVQSRNKSTLGFATDYYDSLTNSAGQDNVGKLLMSILSFMRLRELLGKDYKGGLLLIDEIDATLYPAAQIQLIEALLSFCHNLNLQVIFTTHSPDILKVLYDKRYSKDCKTLYLETRDNKTQIYENLPLNNILAHLRAEVVCESERKIKVFTEDDSGRMFLRSLLSSDIKKKLDFMNVSLGEGELNNLRKAKLPDFLEGLIVFDGDVDSKKPKYRAKNAVSLPGGYAPETVLYKYLKSLPETDKFWDDYPGGYTKQICFSKYETNEGNDIGQVKSWFKKQKAYFGRDCSKLMKRWKEDNIEAVEAFQDEFLSAFKSVGGLVP